MHTKAIRCVLLMLYLIGFFLLLGYCSPREIGIQQKRMGIDTQRIVITESVPLEHLCPVCQLLINPNEALQSMCGHLYCRLCLTYIESTTRTCPYDGYLVTESYAKVLSSSFKFCLPFMFTWLFARQSRVIFFLQPLVESNKVLAEAIGKNLVYCSYQESGCTWVGSLADSSFHCSGCDFGDSHVMCIWCGIHIAHRQWREHVQVCLVSLLPIFMSKIYKCLFIYLFFIDIIKFCNKWLSGRLYSV